MNAFDYLFDESKNLTSDFLLGESRNTSFSQIYQQSLKFASYLKDTIGENKNIILISENSLFSIIAYLAILKSGNVCVPLDPLIEESNLSYIVKTTDAACMVDFRARKSATEDSGFVCFNEFDFEKIIYQKIIVPGLNGETFDDSRLALILYTSGSTGIPKGVMLSHRNIIANTHSIIGNLGLSASDIMGVVLPFYYCYGLSLLHTHLKVGAALVLINNFIFIGSFIEKLKEYKCTGFAGVPSHFQILLKKSQSFLNSEFPHLRYVTQAGGKLHDVFIETFIQAFPNIAFFVMYGQTEATARLSILSAERLNEKMGSIGKAIPGVELRIVDSEGNVLDSGELGEIVAKGDNIMQGYYKDPAGTKEVLKKGWLYTGDIGMVDEDGYIFLDSRKKEIIKLGGKRISPKEIESVILSVSEVVDCTIEGVADELLGESLKAHIVLNSEAEIEMVKSKILRICSQNLSAYKIPQMISFTKHIHMNASGKKVKNIDVV
ncbi:acyl-CoA synthetase (AMP-forming)/AMP-acid ligase II [Ancylomarina subtilis]|uniref:Acyl-CoA synthetase (AMP-forming)/AMP-acid ligase II n=1 Tax=Ancylomarina subtilis TaxID=1639035 RepID=A0A4Q7VKN9_9BACT|nr:AMP-binding protein [Ancylomarina subtilis]RZT96800.1 acyl-CoA synthetase (AMP-forming)/AMP-acid ligase II [Ancylomarina subtilis]